MTSPAAHVLVILEGHAAFLAGCTSRTSSLKRLSCRQLALVDTTLSRIRRTLAPRSTVPSVTRQPATLPTLVMLKTSQDFGVAEHGLAQRRRQHARHRRLHVVDEIVDDVVVADLDAVALGGSRASLARTLKPMITRVRGLASVTSDSVMPPTPACR
jgi:hypothetical protein